MKIIIILFLLIIQYENTKPTTKGIERYVKTQGDFIVSEVQKFLGDSIYFYDIHAEDLRDYQDYDSLELGRFYVHDDIVISNKEEYLEYELVAMPKWERKTIKNSNRFVKAVIIHELIHDYIYQLQNIMEEEGKSIAPEYKNFSTFSNNKRNWQAGFIEEGLCEYVVYKMNEGIYPKKVVVNENNVISQVNNYETKYLYSSYILREFLDSCIIADGNPKNGIETILIHDAPRTSEILNPKIYYQRLRN